MTIKQQKQILYFLEAFLINIENKEENSVSNELSNLFSKKELIEIVLWLYPNYKKPAVISKTKATLLELIGDDANILSFVIDDWKKKMYQVPKLTQEQVTAFLEELQLQLHYLYNKPVPSWDSYDISNYHSILNKHGKTQRVFAIYTADVKAKDKYSVTTLPSLFFDTKIEAEQELIDFCKQQKLDPMDYVIHWLWIIKY